MSPRIAACAAGLAAFVAAVSGGGAMTITGDHGSQAPVPAETAVRSAREGLAVRVDEVLADA